MRTKYIHDTAAVDDSLRKKSPSAAVNKSHMPQTAQNLALNKRHRIWLSPGKRQRRSLRPRCVSKYETLTKVDPRFGSYFAEK